MLYGYHELFDMCMFQTITIFLVIFEGCLGNLCYKVAHMVWTVFMQSTCKSEYTKLLISLISLEKYWINIPWTHPSDKLWHWKGGQEYVIL